MTTGTHDPLLQAALDAAARGWPAFPLRPGDKRPALHAETRCPGTGACQDGHAKPEQRATTDSARIRQCWATGRYNVGVATGPAGLLVVDLDVLKPTDDQDTPSGARAFSALCERAGQAVPTTYRVRTPSGGDHLYFTVPRGIRLPSTKGTLAKKIDTRAWGGYVVAAGSITATAGYSIADRAPVADLPSWLFTLLQPAPAPRTPVTPTAPRQADRCAQAAFERELAAVIAAAEGEREATLFRAARAMGRFVAWGDIPRHVVEEAFQAGGESTGLPSSQCRSTLRSALNWSIRNCQPRATA
ncbi:hypothetical protein SNS2_1529 [Streptomyces netropsis]|nr:hypothetical protein SNS2_1529 [Streptomyces netropsis]